VRYPFPRVSGYKRRSDIKEADIREFEFINVHVNLNLGFANCNESSSPRQLMWGRTPSLHELIPHD